MTNFQSGFIAYLQLFMNPYNTNISLDACYEWILQVQSDGHLEIEHRLVNGSRRLDLQLISKSSVAVANLQII